MPTADDRITRRRFVGAAAGTLGAAALGGPAAALAKPHRRTPFDHVVVLMMENRSFDHFLGWVPGADGRQAGLVYRDEAGVPHATHALAPDFQGCGFADPDHSYQGGRVEYNGGRCDGWLRAGRNDDYAIGYYRRKDLAFFGPAVESLDDVLALLLGDPGRDLPQPLRPARGADRSPGQHLQRLDAARRSGTAWPARG